MAQITQRSGTDPREGSFFKPWLFATGVFVLILITIYLLGNLPPRPSQINAYDLEQVQQLNALEETILTSYGWVQRNNDVAEGVNIFPAEPVTENTGIVRIPIDQAMNMVVEQGLPYRNIGEQAASTDSPQISGQAVEQMPEPQLR